MEHEDKHEEHAPAHHEHGHNEEHHEHEHHEEHEHGQTVTVTVDGLHKHVHTGHYTVAEFKQLVGVDPTKDLDEIVHGEIKPLQDTEKLVIKGGEIFISHARTGGSSADGRR
jgi:hypothetical protein